jgi:hypothetical protein
MLIKAALNKDGSRLILKNPVNTGRIRTMLEIFPEARFVFIMRNPVTAYLSSKKFFTRLFPTLNLEDFSEDDIKQMIVYDYTQLMSDYLAEKALIPKGQLVEVIFEEFESDPLPHIKKIYDTLRLDGYDEAKARFTQYIDDQKDHRMHRYQIKKTELEMVLNKLDFAMKFWKYKHPDNVDVVDQT